MAYQSSITKEQFEVIRPLLEASRRTTRPRKHNLFILLNAVLYLLKNGCTWRDLPNDFPDHNIVYYYFKQWKTVPEGATESVLDIVLKKIGRSGTYEKRRETMYRHGYHGCTEHSERLKRRK